MPLAAFTFHYVSIKTIVPSYATTRSLNFTFHYVSIKTHMHILVDFSSLFNTLLSTLKNPSNLPNICPALNMQYFCPKQINTNLVDLPVKMHFTTSTVITCPLSFLL